MRLILALLLMIGLSACSTGKEAPRTAPSKQPTSTPSGSDDPFAAQPDASDTKACAQVRAGIDAFNVHDYKGSVDRFRLAVPLAQAQARSNPSRGANDLVEAVKYYAGIVPEDYLKAAATPQFVKYQVITLGQCGPGDASSGSSPGVTA